MKIAFLVDDDYVMRDVDEAPDFPFLEVTEAIQQQFDSFINPKLKNDLSGFEENIIITVPESVSRMGLKIQLLLKGITITDIIDTINSIPSYMFPEQQKQIAIIKFQEAAYFDRYNADLQLVATLVGLSQQDLDEIFIDGNKV